MLWISHRGNLFGPDPDNENKIDYINNALNFNVDVEIDVWYIDNTLYLGHDSPQEKVPVEYLTNKHLWFHCKNIEAVVFLQTQKDIKYFWHQDDDYSIVSNGKIWVYPGKMLVKDSIAVVPERKFSGNLWECFAICTDYINVYQNLHGTT
jgi:hypothetical protein